MNSTLHIPHGYSRLTRLAFLLVLLAACLSGGKAAVSRLVSNLSWIAWAKGTLLADPEIETMLVLEPPASIDSQASERAASGFRLALRLNAQNASAYAGEGMTSLTTGELLTGRKLFHQALLLDADNVVWRFWYASLAARLGEDEVAIREWRRIKAAPYFAVYGDKLGARGSWPQAIDLYRRALSIDPASSDVYYRLGIAYGMKLQRWPEAVQHLEKALSMDPANSLVYYYLGIAYVKVQRGPEALRYLQKCLEAGGAERDIHCWMGEAYNLLGDRPAAQASFERCAQLGSIWGHFGMAGAYFSKGDFATAELWYRRAQQLAPEAAGPYLGLGQVAWAQNRPQEAKEFFNQALQKQPNDPTANKQMGLWFFAERQYEDAVYWLERSVTLGIQSDFWVYFNLGGAYTALGRCALAVDNFAKAVQVSQTEPELSRHAEEKLATTQANCPADR